MEIIHGVPCIKGEIHSLITLMRLNTRWSSRSRRQSSWDSNLGEEEDSLIQSFRRLNEYLEGCFDLQSVSCATYIAPFHDVIVSQANGPLTSAALGALSKFALYGFFNSRFPQIREGMTLVARSISHCVFEETDWESDELILMKLLELSALCFRCSASDELTVHSAWEIYCTCISIHNHYRASKILKSEAETALVHLTLSIFNRASSVSTRVAVLRSLLPDSVRPDAPLRDYSEETLLSSHTGVVVMCLKVMRVLAEMLEVPKPSTEHIHFALFLINVALEAGGPALNSIPNVVAMLSDDICRHLLRTSQSEDLGIFSTSLRVVFNLFVSIKDHMKVQLEVFLSSVHLRQLNGADGSRPSSSSSSSPSFLLLPSTPITGHQAAREELVLESLLDFCREPSLMQDLYTNYDCDVQCSNLFDSIIETLCRRAIASLPEAVPVGRLDANQQRSLLEALNTPLRLSIPHRLSMEGLMAALHAVAGRSFLVSLAWNSWSPENSPWLIGTGQEQDDPANVEVQVDRWCETMSEPENVCDDDSYPGGGMPSKVNGELGYERLDPVHHNRPASHAGVHSSPSVGNSLPPQAGRGGAFGSSNTSFVVLSRSNSCSDTRSIHSQDDAATPTARWVDGENESTGDHLRRRKLVKQRLRSVIAEFNQKPLKMDWIHAAVEAGLLPAANTEGAPSAAPASGNHAGQAPSEPTSSAAVAQFFRATPGLGKTQIGEYISKGPAHMYPFHASVLREYVATFDFSQSPSIDKAMRQFLGAFRLPGEAQCIDRIMEAFSARFYQQQEQAVQQGGQQGGNVFASADAAFILAFSTIMLNTDLHNPGIPSSKKMTREEFIRNNRGINAGQDLPREYLVALYDEIRANQIQVDIDMADPKAGAVDVTDPTVWNRLIHAQNAAPALFTPTGAARRREQLQQRSLLHRKRSHSLHGAGIAGSQMAVVAAAAPLCTSKSEPIQAADDMAQERGGVPESFLRKWSCEADMFLIMVTPFWRTYQRLWSQPLDDQWTSRLLQCAGLLLAACDKLNLHRLYNHIWILLTTHAVQWLARLRELPMRPYQRTNLLASRSAYEQWRSSASHGGQSSKSGTGLSTNGASHDLLALATSPLPQLCGHGAATVGTTGAASAAPISWNEGALIKAELMLKLTLHMATQAAHILEPRAWTCLYRALLWTRGRGALPLAMSTLQAEFALPQCAVKLRHPCTAHMARLGVRAVFWTSADDVTPSSFGAPPPNPRRQAMAYGISSSRSIRAIAVNGVAADPVPIPVGVGETAHASAKAGAAAAATVAAAAANGSLHADASLPGNNGTSSSSPPLPPAASSDGGGWMSWVWGSSTPSATGGGAQSSAAGAVGFASSSVGGSVGIIGTGSTLQTTGSMEDNGMGGISSPDEVVETAIDSTTLGFCTNAFVSIDATGTPLRPDDAVLAAVLDHTDGLWPLHHMGVCSSPHQATQLSGLSTLFSALLAEVAPPAAPSGLLLDDPLPLSLPAMTHQREEDEAVAQLGPLPAMPSLVSSSPLTGELEACLVVDWLATATMSAWPSPTAARRMHRLLRFLLAEEVEALTLHSPAIVERGVYWLFRVLLQSLAAPPSSLSTASLWMLVPLVARLPTDCGRTIAAAGVIACLRLAASRPTLSSEEWGTLFSFTAQTILPTNRRSAWACLRLALPVLGPENFAGIRLLLKALLNAHVRPLGAGSSSGSVASAHGADSVELLLMGLDALVKLTLSACSPHTVHSASKGEVTFPPPLICPPLPPQQLQSRPAAAPIAVKLLTVATREEAQQQWLEACALLGDLCWVDCLRGIDSAQRGLELLVAAESVLCFQFSALSLLEELVGRLPLNIVSTTGRLQAVLGHAEIVHVCYRACNLCFSLFTRNARALRTAEHYNALYLRFVSALVTNASVSPRSQALHEEMLGMAVAMLRLLQLPTYLTHASAESAQPSTPSLPKSAAAGADGAKHGSASDSPVAKGAGGTADGASEVQNASLLEQASSAAPQASAQETSSVFSFWNIFRSVEPAPVRSTTPPPSPLKPSAKARNSTEEQTSSAVFTKDHDRDLLCLAWKTTTSLYSLFPGLVKARDPQLYAALVYCIDHAPPVMHMASPVKQADHSQSSSFGSPSQAAQSTPIKQLRSPQPRPFTPSTVQVV